MNDVIYASGLTKSYSRHLGHKLLRDYLSAWFGRAAQSVERFYALRDISFSVRQGESLAIIGHNGAGKSTLLNLVAGLSRPDAGTLRIDGRVTPLLDLGSGFHPDLTGTENLFLNAALLGLTRRQTRDRYEAILEFSGVGDFIEEPLRTYSSGMMLRLAFSIAIHVDPDILLVDEVLAVGDADFQAKCVNRIQRFREEGKTILCVSHARGMVQDLCDRALWLDHGVVRAFGPIDEVVDQYSQSLAAAQGA
jgi:lipopolysaccharide transport system ATP-binding protein